jgi:hypothetical protein
MRFERGSGLTCRRDLITAHQLLAFNNRHCLDWIWIHNHFSGGAQLLGGHFHPLQC